MNASLRFSLTSCERLASAWGTVEKYCDASTLLHDEIAESRLLKHVCLHHGFYNLLVLCFNCEFSRSHFTKFDRFKVIYFDQR